MSYIPKTTWANGIHPLAKPPKVPAPAKPRVHRPDLTEYTPITAHQVTLFLRERPDSTLTEIRTALNASVFNTERMLRRLRAEHKITRQRASEHDRWHYTAHKVAPEQANYVRLIKQCLAEHPNIPARDILKRTGVPDILCKLKRLRLRKEIVAVSRMTPNFGRAVKHYSLREAA